MNARTLVLTPRYFPFTTVDTRVAVTLLYLRKAEVVASYPEEIRSPSTTLNMPAVIRLRRQVKSTQRGTEFSQSNLYLCHNFACAGCDDFLPALQPSYDHVGPRTRGGPTVWTHILTARGDTRSGTRTSAIRGGRSTSSSLQPLELPLDPPLADPATAADDGRDSTAVWRRS